MGQLAIDSVLFADSDMYAKLLLVTNTCDDGEICLSLFSLSLCCVEQRCFFVEDV